MKNKYMFIFMLAMSLMLPACGSDTKDGNQTGTQGETDTTGESAKPDAPSDQPSDVVNQDEMQQKMDELDYAGFDLAVEYANHQEYEAELEKSSNNSIKAEIEDDLNAIKKKGSDAFNELYPLVKQLTITGQTSKEGAIQEILTVFNLPADYQEFELDIRFKDGTKLEFEDRK